MDDHIPDVKWVSRVTIMNDNNNAAEEHLADEIVMDLTKNLRKSGRIVTCDKFFTSVSLADNLYKESTYMQSYEILVGPCEFFFWILDAAAFNAYRIYQIRNFEGIGETVQETRPKIQNVEDSRLKFICSLPNSLMGPQQDARGQSNHWYAKGICKIKKLHEEMCEKYKTTPKDAVTPPELEDISIPRTRCGPCDIWRKVVCDWCITL
uniref:PiggyBac transposable element-derived protein domain-containing protein n=1 Tax=Romanomermis culicivorax TaxID=13658 RepID=A0A915HJY1_ROMCU